MKTPFGALLALILALPGAAAGPTVRAGRLAPTALPVGGPPLGLSAAPSLAAGALTPTLAAPALAPSLAAPVLAPAPALAAPALLAPAPAAPAEAPKLAGADGAAAAAAGAQAALRSGDAGSARLSGVGTFDGGALPAASDAPEVPGAPSAPRRLAPPGDDEVVAAFREARPGSKAVELVPRGKFAAAAADLLMQYTFASRGFVEELESRVGLFDREGRKFLSVVKDLVAAHDGQDEASRRFSGLAGRYYAFMDASQDRMQDVFSLLMGRGGEQRHMPPAPRGVEGEYWDMAAGINGGRYVRRSDVDAATPYVMFDLSPFAASYIRASAEIAGKPNVTVREQDLLEIGRPSKPLAVLRTKNAIAYVPGFGKKLEAMADWVAEGGQLVIQTDPSPPQREGVVREHGPLISRLLAAGWTMEFGFSGSRGPYGDYGYDTLVLTRPRGTVTVDRAAAAKSWATYTGAVEYANKRQGW